MSGQSLVPNPAPCSALFRLAGYRKPTALPLGPLSLLSWVGPSHSLAMGFWKVFCTLESKLPCSLSQLHLTVPHFTWEVARELWLAYPRPRARCLPPPPPQNRFCKVACRKQIGQMFLLLRSLDNVFQQNIFIIFLLSVGYGRWPQRQGVQGTLDPKWIGAYMKSGISFGGLKCHSSWWQSPLQLSSPPGPACCCIRLLSAVAPCILNPTEARHMGAEN